MVKIPIEIGLSVLVFQLQHPGGGSFIDIELRLAFSYVFGVFSVLFNICKMQIVLFYKSSSANYYYWRPGGIHTKM